MGIQLDSRYIAYEIFWIFMICGVAGAFIEIIFCRLTSGQWMSRSSLLYGQFSIVWGLGVALFAITFRRAVKKGIVYIFIIGSIAGGIFEYCCSYVIEKFLKVRFWDYSGIRFNLHGRINLLYCGFWGAIAIFWVRLAYPFLHKVIAVIPLEIGRPLAWICAVLLIINICLTAAALLRMVWREADSGLKKETQLGKILDRKYPTEYLCQRYKNLTFLLAEKAATNELMAVER